MPPKSSFIPRIKVSNQFSNILLHRPKMGLRAESSKSVSASLRNKFTNCAQDYMNYDDEVLDKKSNTFLPGFG